MWQKDHLKAVCHGREPNRDRLIVSDFILFNIGVQKLVDQSRWK